MEGLIHEMGWGGLIWHENYSREKGKRSRMAERGSSAQDRRKNSPYGPKALGNSQREKVVGKKMNTDIIHRVLESLMNIGKGVCPAETQIFSPGSVFRARGCTDSAGMVMASPW